jgi:hypothetical protein
MATLKDIVVDAAHPAAIARFWAAALDGYAVAPYDDAELARLRANGIYDVEDDPSVVIEPVPGAVGPRLIFQLVPEAKSVKNRMHLDVRADDRAAELERLCALGASVIARYEGHTTLADPEGNEFCLTA